MVDGELWHKSPAVFVGYLNQPEETEKVLKDGWYKTNDILKVDDDGYYWYIGRKNDAFKVKGHKVYPKQIDSILEQHPLVDQAACVPVADEKKTHTIEAIIVSKCHIDNSELNKLFHDSGISHALPKKYLFVDSLPVVESSTKIDRKELEKLAKPCN